MKRKITITLKREVSVEVVIDESVINEKILDAINDNFDNTIYDQPESCRDELSKNDRGLYNYALTAAIVASGMGESEFITLGKEHTKAVVGYDDVSGVFEEMEAV